MTLKDTQVQVIKALGMDFEAMNPPFQQSGFALSMLREQATKAYFDANCEACKSLKVKQWF
jgi:hypothetical protein|tara:strand:- start:61 stop:243 length:183 start_codon:yes stop_codon:yes gene_type:complete